MNAFPFSGHIARRRCSQKLERTAGSKGNLLPLIHTAMAVLAIGLGGNVFGRDALTSSQALTYTDGVSSIPYRLFQPTGFANADVDFPLVIFMHGSGERGSNNTAQVTSHIQGLIDRTETTNPAYLIAPQVPSNQDWNGTPLRLALDLVEQFTATHNVDPARIYITGLSMGGFGTFRAIESRPSLFAGAVPMSGGGNPSFGSTYAQIPIWAFHGSTDGSVNVSSTRNTITAIQSAGGTRERYTELAGQGHVIWAPIYSGGNYAYDTNYTGTFASEGSGNMYSWLFAQQIPEPTASALLLVGLAFGAARSRSRAD